MNLAQTLTQSAANWPDKTALVFEGRRWTYAQWNRTVNQAAHAFRAAGIGKGDRVAFLTYNLPEQVTGFYALMKIGAVPVPINYRLAANEVKYIVDDSKRASWCSRRRCAHRSRRSKTSSGWRSWSTSARSGRKRDAFRQVHRAGLRGRARGRGRLARPRLHHVHLRHDRSKTHWSLEKGTLKKPRKR